MKDIDSFIANLMGDSRHYRPVEAAGAGIDRHIDMPPARFFRQVVIWMVSIDQRPDGHIATPLPALDGKLQGNVFRSQKSGAAYQVKDPRRHGSPILPLDNHCRNLVSSGIMARAKSSING